MATHEREPDLDAHVTRALHELLTGRVPIAEDTDVLKGDVKACIEALTAALHADGVQAVRQAFLALATDRPWLPRLASQQPSFSSDEAASNEQPTRRIRFLPTSTFLDRPLQEWLIPALLPRDSIVMVYGPSGTYKSFLTMGWSLSIATGPSWIGRAVTHGPVAYICAEGSYGIGKRVKAWMMHQDYTDLNTIDTNLKWFDETLVLQDAGNLQELLTALTEDFNESPVLVVIDTLSRCSAGADENSNTDMAKVLASADVIRQHLHCTVLIVHHVGKDTGRGPRGASALFGNTETLIAVDGTSLGSKVSCAKSKDAPKFEDIHLRTHIVSYGPSEEESSLVLLHSDEPAPVTMSKAETLMYTVLQGKELTHTEWVNAGLHYARELQEKLAVSTAKAAIKSLKENKRVHLFGKKYAHVNREQEGQEENSEE